MSEDMGEEVGEGYGEHGDVEHPHRKIYKARDDARKILEERRVTHNRHGGKIITGLPPDEDDILKLQRKLLNDGVDNNYKG